MLTFPVLLQKISLYSDGVTARKLASLLNASHTEVNRLLYQHETELIHKGALWSLPRNTEANDPMLSKLEGKSTAKLFTLEEFNALAEWNNQYYAENRNSDNKYITKTGNIIYLDSRYERDFLKYIEDKNLAYAIGGQRICLAYSSHFVSNRYYYPDIFMLTKDHHIAVVEIKAANAMDYHLNLSKYEYLSGWSTERGYEYMMIDPKGTYTSLSDLLSMQIDPELINMVSKYMAKQEPYMYFSGKRGNNIVETWYRHFSLRYSKAEFDRMLHALIIQKNWYNTYSNGFSVYSRPVKLNASHEVIDYI